MATTTRSAKRRKLSPPEEDSPATHAKPSTPARSPAKGKLKRPARRNGLLLGPAGASPAEDEPTGTATRSGGRRSARNNSDDVDVYDDIDGAFADTPTRQLQGEATKATKLKKTTAQPRETAEGKRTGTRRKATAEEHIQEDDIAADKAKEEDRRTARRSRRKRNETDNMEIAGNSAEQETGHGHSTNEINSTPAQTRRGRRRAKLSTGDDFSTADKAHDTAAAPKADASAKKQLEVNGHEDEESADEPEDRPSINKKQAGKTNTPAKQKGPATHARQGAASLFDLMENENKSSGEVSKGGTPEPELSPRAKRKAAIDAGQPMAKPVATVQGPGKPPADGDLTLLKSIILERVTGKRPTPLVGLGEEYKKVHHLVEQTVNAGEGNSMLVIGARGSGKTAMVNKVLSVLSHEQRQDFHIIRLNGFVHTDDKLALREIWRQLGREMDVEEDSLGKNYADTLSTLLALLSHPSELAGQESEEIAKAVIFVMDEFDLFASHPRQTLLYNLFDIAQSKKAPITVLGLTTRIGVAESLEKRVKSRFSHRYVHLSLAKSFTSFQEMCKAVLSIQQGGLDDEDYPHTGSANKNKKGLPKSDLVGKWNELITHLFEDPTFIQTHLAPHYYLNKSVPAALSSLHLPISALTPSDFPLSVSHFSALAAPIFTPPDSKLALLSSISDLQLALLIAAARLDIIHDTDTVNFNMAYAEYVALASRAKIQSAAGGALASGAGTKVWGREVARGEWERLIGWELLIPVVGGGVGGGAGAQGATAMVKCDVALEEIAPSVPGLDRLMEKWCRQI